MKKIFPTMLTALALSSSFVGCAKKTQKDTLVYCSEGSPSAFNPQITTDGTSNNASSYTVYSRLVDFAYGTTTIVPSLAESWEISQNGLQYIFHLRKDVSFHSSADFTPTRLFNTDDVLFSFNRMRLKNHPYHATSGGNYEYWNGMDMNNIVKDIEKIDAHTLKITLHHPEAPFLANLAMGFMSILSAEYGDHLAKNARQEDIDNKPIGTGPFVFQQYSKDSLIRFTAFDKYFESTPEKKVPLISNLIFVITPDPHVRAQKLKAQECHIAIEPAPTDLEDLKRTEHLSVIESPGLNVGYLAMNTKKAPLDNLKVRQAIHHALNRPQYLENIYQGFGMLAKSPLPPTIWGHEENILTYEFNVEKARELLKESGVSLPIKLDLWSLPVSRPYNPNGKKMAELMQADLKNVGIEANIVTFDWPTYLAKSRAGEHQLIQMGWTGDNGDPDNFLHYLLSCTGVESGSNLAKWCDPEFDKIVNQAKALSAVDQRTILYKAAQQIFAKASPWVPIAHSVVFRALHKDLQNYKMGPLGNDIFRYVFWK
jgi:dipeptide transport system substrate-binding protein